jgi:hypothetical protein
MVRANALLLEARQAVRDRTSVAHHQIMHAVPRQRVASSVDEDGRGVRSIADQRPQGAGRARPEGTPAHFRPLAQQAHRRLMRIGQIEVADRHADRFARPRAGVVQEKQHRVVAEA